LTPVAHFQLSSTSNNTKQPEKRTMTIDPEMTHEMSLLLKFDPDSMQHGLKIHSDAPPSIVAAAQRLYAKGLIDQPDGGFLTSLGHQATEHARALHQILDSAPDTRNEG